MQNLKMQTLRSVCIIPFVTSTLYAQQFTVEWEFETLNRVIYVGDIDGDGTGEFVDNTYLDDVQFYDAQTHQVKYTVTGPLVTIEETSVNLTTYNNRFPYIDFNNNGIRDFIFVDLFNPTDPIYRVIDPSTNSVIFEFPPNGPYQFGWLGDFDNDGILELSVSYYGGAGSTHNVIYSTGVALTAIQDREKYWPSNFHLNQNYPNPFNPSTTIEYSVEQAGRTRLEIYNNLGQLVRTLIDDQKPAGKHSLFWDGRDNRGAQLPSGSYFYRLLSGDHTSTRSMVLIK
jgi:hypothetical protein